MTDTPLRGNVVGLGVSALHAKGFMRLPRAQLAALCE
jgi:hypothetical protein